MNHAIVGLRMLLLGALLACPSAAHQEAAPSATSGPGEVVARLPRGSGPDQVGGDPSGTPQSAIEPVPASFLCDDSGAVHILDTPNRRIMVLKPGDKPTAVSLAALGDAAIAIDFVLRGKGWLVADRAANVVVEVGPDGAAGARWSGFQGVQRLEAAGDTVLARDEIALALSRLEPGGKLAEASKNPHALPVIAGGAPVMARVLAGHAVFTAGAQNTVYTLPPHQPGDDVQGLEVAGTDAKGALVLAIHEGKGDDRRGVWLTRIAQDGEVQGELLVPPIDDRASMPPRFFRALADGRVLGFRTTESAYELQRLTLAPSSPARRAAPATTPEEAAKAALCNGDPAARATVAGAALAAAFDDAASARLERDLAALDAGAPAAALCALASARAALDAGDPAKALKLVEPVNAEAVKDRRLYIEAQALAGTDLRESLRRWQRLVLDHADSPHFPEANDQVLRIIDSGKLPGAQPK